MEQGGQDAAKKAAARAGVDLIEPGFVVGFGSGTTVDFALEAWAELRQQIDGVRLVVASSRSEAQCRRLGLTTIDPDSVDKLDLLLDGADEIDPALRLIKGGGGALVREKLLATLSKRFVVIADRSKLVPNLGAFPLPVAVVPFGAAHTLARLQRYSPEASLRMSGDRRLVTDDGLNIIDLPLGQITSPEALDSVLQSEPGVVETGLFVHLTDEALVGCGDGSVRRLERPLVAPAAPG